MSHFNESPQWGGHNKGKIAPTNRGTGPLFWVRDALGDSREQFAPRLGAEAKAIENWERKGKYPTREVVLRANLLGLARTIPECDLTPELRQYMEGEVVYFAKLDEQLKGVR